MKFQLIIKNTQKGNCYEDKKVENIFQIFKMIFPSMATAVD